jgi:CubicO group peptidase (beta-lactamase class C family)
VIDRGQDEPMDVDPSAAGFDEARLARITEHLDRSYVTPGKIAGCQTAVVRHGRLAHFSSLGSMDLERGKPMADDTIFRIYSMTKPITGVALMSLYEQGYFKLSDPIHRFIPAFRDVKVRETAADGSTRLVAADRPVSVRDVMMHMSGIGLDWFERRAEMNGGDPLGAPPDMTLESMCDDLATRPLGFQPGTRWFYSVSTDICARLVEVISGQRFDDYLAATIFDPLGMVDTGFHVPDAKAERFATNYRRSRHTGVAVYDDAETSAYRRERAFLSGGGGLVSTTSDYVRFASMLLNGGRLDGTRVLGRRTIEFMTTNHLPGGGQLGDFALPGSYGEAGTEGVGFGLTMAVSIGERETQIVGTRGDYYWGGAASTAFWVDPTEDLAVVFMTQLIPSGSFDFRGQLKSIIYGAIAD